MPFRLFLATLFSILMILASLNPNVAYPSPNLRRNTCLRNCHVCKSMYGNKFEGHLCAHTCIKLRGKIIPDCRDLVSIAPFLDPNYLDSNDIWAKWSNFLETFRDLVYIAPFLGLWSHPSEQGLWSIMDQIFWKIFPKMVKKTWSFLFGFGRSNFSLNWPENDLEIGNVDMNWEWFRRILFESNQIKKQQFQGSFPEKTRILK